MIRCVIGQPIRLLASSARRAPYRFLEAGPPSTYRGPPLSARCHFSALPSWARWRILRVMDLGGWDAVRGLLLLLVGVVTGWVARGPVFPRVADGPPSDPAVEGRRRAREQWEAVRWEDACRASFDRETKRLRLADDPLRARAPRG